MYYIILCLYVFYSPLPFCVIAILFISSTPRFYQMSSKKIVWKLFISGIVEIIHLLNSWGGWDRFLIKIYLHVKSKKIYQNAMNLAQKNEYSERINQCPHSKPESEKSGPSSNSIFSWTSRILDRIHEFGSVFRQISKVSAIFGLSDIF